MPKVMEKCDFCLYKQDCIGEFPGPDGHCLVFAVPPEQQAAFEAFNQYARMTLDQLIETRDKLQHQLAVLDQLIAEQSPEVTGND